MRASSGPAAGPGTGAAPAETGFARQAGAAPTPVAPVTSAADEDAAAGDDAETEATSVVGTSALRSDSGDAGVRPLWCAGAAVQRVHATLWRSLGNRPDSGVCL